MHKSSYHLLCLFNLLNLIVLHQAVEYDEVNLKNHETTYNLNSLIAKSLGQLQNEQNFKEEFPGSVQIDDLGFNDFNFRDLSVENSSKCSRDLNFTVQNLYREWALRMIDSFGKPQSGLLQGNVKWLGDYNECVKIRSTNENSSETGNFRGKYCSVSPQFPFGNTTVPMSIQIGICVPDSCSEKELIGFFNYSSTAGNFSGNFSVSNRTDSKITISCKPTERHLSTDVKVVVAIISVFLILTVLGSSLTAVKYFKKAFQESNNPPSLIVNVSESEAGRDAKSATVESDGQPLVQDGKCDNETNGALDKLQAFLGCFCVFTNGAKLLNTDSSEGQLLCIHGIRFLSMSWVILGHSYLFCFSEIGNVLEAAKLLGTFPFQVVIQGFYSVDSFFVLSGFLLTYLSMKEFSKTKGVIPWTYFYVHRYIRLTPIYMIILAFSATIYLYLGSGPFWPEGDYDKLCRESWWWNLLYINNFRSMSKQCMGWSWYLANDMQFFAISPLFLITLWRWPTIGFSLIATFVSACFVANFYITYDHELMPGLVSLVGSRGITNVGQVMEKYMMYFDKLYIKPYTRIGPYLVGILVGYILFKRKASGQPKHSLIFICIGWIVASSVTLTCVYGLYDKVPSVLASSFYNGLNRTLFGMGLCWVIYVCLIGQGGVVNSILSYKLFIPLSRLTYAAYLIHPMIITGYFASLKQSLEFTHPTVVMLFLGFMLVTYGLALPVALILESPIVSLEKLIRKSFSKKTSS